MVGVKSVDADQTWSIAARTYSGKAAFAFDITQLKLSMTVAMSSLQPHSWPSMPGVPSNMQLLAANKMRSFYNTMLAVAFMTKSLQKLFLNR